MNLLTNRIFYFVKPIIPRWVQISLRKKIASKKFSKYKDIWPIYEKACIKPNKWQGWPENKQFALILTHDVETKGGMENCHKLIEIEKKLGLRSSINFVPERYKVSNALINFIKKNEFEIGVHGLKHDGKLFLSKKVFSKRAPIINKYLDEWGAIGFYSPAMHHNLAWLHMLNIEYDSSTFDVDPFEPQPDGVGKIFPFQVKDNNYGKNYIELPYTLPQDITLFIILEEKNIGIWKKKLNWIADNGGMVLLKTHPDYMKFNKDKHKLYKYPVELYIEFIEYVKNKYRGEYWHVLPKKIAQYWMEKYSF